MAAYVGFPNTMSHTLSKHPYKNVNTLCITKTQKTKTKYKKKRKHSIQTKLHGYVIHLIKPNQKGHACCINILPLLYHEYH